MVVSDAATADSLPSLPVGTELSVLIHNEHESDQDVNARALTMRHATLFVYVSRQASNTAGPDPRVPAGTRLTHLSIVPILPVR